MAGMPWDEIPKTFKDAIIVARFLQLRFLWIDSLCIVQDDLNDWAKESSKMSHIYANATITIAAAAAADDMRGFLGQRHHLNSPVLHSTDGLIKIRRDIHRDLSEPGRLMTRAWVFQERLLSRRILYFEEHEMVWECRSAKLCECGSDLTLAKYRLPEQMLTRATEAKFREASPLTTYDFTHPTKENSETFAWWRETIVHQYTALQLTKWTDRLPALSGLAAITVAKTQDTYLGGIWKSELIHGLLWEPNWGNQSPKIPSDYLAPSWSWASLPCQISYTRVSPTTELATLVNHDIRLATVDPTGSSLLGYFGCDVT